MDGKAFQGNLALAWLAAIVESSADAVIGETLEGTVTSWNAAAERIYGYAAEEAIGQPISMLVPAEAADDLACLFERVRRGERIQRHETVRRCKDGKKVDVALSLSPICDAAGAIVGVATIARDVTDQRRLERELREGDARHRLAVEAARIGTWFWYVKTERLEWTPLCRSMHGIGPADEVSFERFLAIVHPDDRGRTDDAVRRSFEQRCDFRIEHRVVWPDGSVHWLAGLGRPFYDEAGEPERMLGVSLDITEHKQAEQERAGLLERERAALAEAHAAARAKDDFLATLSHELRTPLQAMLGWTQLLKARVDDAAAMQRKGLETIERNARTQAQLIEDLLDVSRIVAGKLRVDRGRVDLVDVVTAALESARSAAEAKAIRLDATIEPVGGVVLGDATRLQQVVANLLANAVKFTPSGGQIRVRLEPERATARIVVDDSGRGMSPDLLPYVFDRFRQAESATTRRQGGLGLGLAIVRHIVELHGGTVRAESPGEGLGSTFTVTLPVVDAEPSAVLAERARQGRGRGPVALDGVRVLVVDDDADARDLLEIVLHEAGAEVHAVASVRAALDALTSFRPQLLLSDIGMPEEDGYALIREVRAREPQGDGRIPAVALTAFASCAEREEALALGFDAHFAKPANADDLARTVASLVGRAA
jgi:PAS domain S-box-containing protein